MVFYLVANMSLKGVVFQPAASYSYDSSQLNITKQHLWAWPDGRRFPPDTPRCGFMGEECAAAKERK